MKSNKIKKWLGLLMAGVCTLGACAPIESSNSSSSSSPSSEEQTVSAKLSATEISLLVGQTQTLTVSDYSGAIAWTTSNASIATVSEGIVVAVGEGIAYITAKCGDEELTCKISVTQQEVAVPTLILDKSKTKIGKGYTLTITPYLQIGLTIDKLDRANVVWQTSDVSIATVNQGVVAGVKTGEVTITACYEKDGETLTESATLTVVNINYHKVYYNGEEVTALNPVDVVVADTYFNSTTKSSASVKIMEVELDTGIESDVTSEVVLTSRDETVATATGTTITGGTRNGETEMVASIGGKSVATVAVAGWTELASIEQMNKLALATWTERADEEKVKTILNGRYILGNDIDYNGVYLLPIANTQKDERIDHSSGLVNYQSWVWEDILKPITAEADWNALNFNTKSTSFTGSNPLNLPFTGTFDGNGYSIKNAQILDVNYFFANRANNTYYIAGGGCFMGTIGETGVLKNVNFEDLRWRKYYCDTTAERQSVLDPEKYPRTNLYCAQAKEGDFVDLTEKRIPYYDSVLNGNDSALVRTNKGLITDVRISTRTITQKAIWSDWTGSEEKISISKNPAIGVGRNDGTVNALVVELLEGELTWLRHSDFVQGADYNWNSGFMNETAILFNVNGATGMVTNSLYLSHVKSGASVLSTLQGKTQHNVDTHILNCGDVSLDETSKGKVELNKGFVSDCGEYYATNNKTVYEIFNEAGFAMVGFNASAWDMVSLEMQKGIWQYK